MEKKYRMKEKNMKSKRLRRLHTIIYPFHHAIVLVVSFPLKKTFERSARFNENDPFTIFRSTRNRKTSSSESTRNKNRSARNIDSERPATYTKSDFIPRCTYIYIYVYFNGLA